MTSNIQRVFPFQILLPAAETGLDRDSKAKAEEVRSISVERMRDQLGVVPKTIMLDIDEALALHLRLHPTELCGNRGARCSLDASGPQRRS